MNIIGIEKSSFIDYPKEICTVLFTGGCNFRCPYCHNSSIVNNCEEKIDEEEMMGFLRKRKKFVKAICISGGEPTLQKDLYSFLLYLKREGFKVKLDTNGTNPKALKNLIEERLLDYVAMDVKSTFEKYEIVTKAVVNIDDIKASINLLLEGKVEYEFRTTICKEYFNLKDIEEIIKLLKNGKRYIIQNFRDSDGVLVGKSKLKPFSSKELKEIEGLKSQIEEFKIR